LTITTGTFRGVERKTPPLEKGGGVFFDGNRWLPENRKREEDGKVAEAFVVGKFITMR